MNWEKVIWKTFMRFSTIVVMFYTLQGIYLGYKLALVIGIPLSLFLCWLENFAKKGVGE